MNNHRTATVMERPRKSKQRGSLMVESALVMLVFMTLLISLFDFSQVLYVHQGITERVRTGLRYGIVNTYDATAIKNYVIYGDPAAPSGSSAWFNLTSDMVAVERDDAGTSDDRIKITVSNYPYIFLSPFIAGSRTGSPIMETLPYEGQ